MTLILSGTAGLSDVDGSAATPAIRGTDTNTGIFFPAADTVGITTGGTERARVDSSGNLGLGVTPSAWQSIRRALQVGDTSAFFYGNNQTAVGNNVFINSSGQNAYIKTGATAQMYLHGSDGSHLWFNAPSGTAGNTISFTQAMTLDASGRLGIGATSPSTLLHIYGSASNLGISQIFQNSSGTEKNWLIGRNNVAGGFEFTRSTAAGGLTFTTPDVVIDSSGNLLVNSTSTVGAGKIGIAFDGSPNNGIGLKETGNFSGAGFCVFQNSAGTTIGSIARVTTTNAVAYNTTSDQRLKSNIKDAAPVLDKLMGVKVRQYDWTEGDLHQDYGFIAQELEPVLSGIVTKGKTEEDIWQLDYSKLTPHLVKAIQEQQALIAQLQADVAALKGTP